MGTRTVRLDDDTEKVLQEVVQSTGMTFSAAFKQGLLALRDRLTEEATVRPYDIYEQLDLGPGGYAIAPATEVRRGVQEAIRRKHRR